MKRIVTHGLSKVESEQLSTYLSVCMPDVAIEEGKEEKRTGYILPGYEQIVEPHLNKIEYRLLEQNEIIRIGDEYFNVSRNEWEKTGSDGKTVSSQTSAHALPGRRTIPCYRRKL